MYGHLGRLCLALLATAAVAMTEARAQGLTEESQLIAAVTQEGDPLVRAAAAEALGKIEQADSAAAERVATVLTEALALDFEFPVRGRAAEALGRLGPVTQEVVPALSEALAWDTHLMVRWHVTGALARIAAQHPQTSAEIVPVGRCRRRCAA